MSEIQQNWKSTFIRLWLGQSFSLITSSMVQYALIWYITYTTNSAFWLAIASLVGFLPQGILGLFVGSYVDRSKRKNILIGADGFIALVSIIIAIYGFIQEIPIWMVLVALAFRSVGNAFHSPALQASIPLIVPEDQLLKYNGYTQSIQSFALILSPALAAVIYNLMPLNQIILFDIIGFIAAFVTLINANIPNVIDKQKVDQHFIQDSIDGFKNIKNNRVLVYLFVISGIFMLVYMPLINLFPLIITNYFKGSTFDVAFAESFFSIGMLLGGLIVAKFKFFNNSKYNIIGSMLVIGIATALQGVIPPQALYFFQGLTLITGLCAPVFQATVSTIFAKQSPPEMLGRLYANFTSLSVLTMPLGLFLSGLFADQIGISTWFLITGVAITILGIGAMFNHLNLDEAFIKNTKE